jgi:hypothetical protein
LKYPNVAMPGIAIGSPRRWPPEASTFAIVATTSST